MDLIADTKEQDLLPEESRDQIVEFLRTGDDKLVEAIMRYARHNKLLWCREHPGASGECDR